VIIVKRLVWFLAVAGLAAACGRSHSSEVLLSAGITLTRDWQEMNPPSEMRTTAEWNELLIEVPGLRFDRFGNRLVTDDGTTIEIDGYLTTDTKERVDLEKASWVDYGGRTFVRLSSPALEWKRQDRRFRSVSLKCDRSLKVGKVIWLSYDPRATKDGVAYPRSLTPDR
jgi:hypothetical protein